MGVEIEPSISLSINGRLVSSHSLEALMALSEEGSQNKAARRLGISVPVMHRYLRKMEERVGEPLLLSSPTGTRLTEAGNRIVREYSALKSRVKAGETVVVGATIITEELLLSVLSSIDKSGRYDLVISDDARNLRDFQAGLMDVLVLDDPLYLYDIEGVRWEEVAEDNLVHVHRGQDYLRFKYGAQRLGFKHLEDSGSKFRIKGTVRSLTYLLDSGLSFFVNQSLLSRKGVRLRSASESNLLSHKIVAVYRDDTEEVLRLVRELGRTRLI